MSTTIATTSVAAGASARPDLDLEATARAIVADSARWEPLVRFAEPRVCVRIDAGPDAEAWLLMWTPGQGTGLHDHGGASGCFTVLRAAIWETTVDADGAERVARYEVGDIRGFDGDVIHDVRNEGPVGAVTLHLYRPELAAMTHYSRDSGVLSQTGTRFAGLDW